MRKSAKSVLDKDIRMRVMLKDDIELDCGDKVEILGRNGEVCETLMVAMKPVYHEDLICGGFGNLDVYLVDRDG